MAQMLFPSFSNIIYFILWFVRCYLVYFTLPILCVSGALLCVRASCYGKSKISVHIAFALPLPKSTIQLYIVVAFAIAIAYAAVAAAAAIWIHGFSLSLLLAKYIFLFCSSWTPVTFANFFFFLFVVVALCSDCLHLVSVLLIRWENGV